MTFDDTARRCGRDDRLRLHGRAPTRRRGARPPGSSTCRRAGDGRRRRPRPPTRVAAAAERFGWARADTDWRRVVERDDIDLVDVCAPGDSHAEIAIAALEAGKHVLCEKPLANTVAEAEAMAGAAAEAAAAASARWSASPTAASRRSRWRAQLIADGRLGAIRQVRALYLQDWLADEDVPADLAARQGAGRLRRARRHRRAHRRPVQFLTGRQLDRSSAASLETFVTERPLLGERRGPDRRRPPHRARRGHRRRRRLFHRRADGRRARDRSRRPGSRPGRKNALRIEISGSSGALAFDLEDLNELEFYDATAPAAAGLPPHPRDRARASLHRALVAARPRARLRARVHAPGRRLRRRRSTPEQPRPSFADGLQVQRVLDAVETSSTASGCWTPTS